MVEAYDVKKYLEFALPENYKQKFDRVIQPNEFSVSTLVDGPGVAMSYRTVSYDPGVEKKFNTYFFRGTAIHDKVNERLQAKIDVPNGIPNEWLIKQELTMDFPANNGQWIKVYGHPDAINSVKPIVLEFKTLDSEDRNYRLRVMRKAQRQVGCYAQMISEYDEEQYEAFVVVFDFVKKTPLTDEQMERGVGLRNGLFETQLTEMDLEYGKLLNDPMFVVKLTPDEISHAYNYVRWCARSCWDRISDPDSLLGAGLC